MAKRPGPYGLDKREGTVEDKRTEEEHQREIASLKEQIALLKHTLAAERRENNGLQQILYKQTLIEGSQFKNSIVIKLQSKIRHLQRKLEETKDQLKRERERNGNSEEEELWSPAEAHPGL